MNTFLLAALEATGLMPFCAFRAAERNGHNNGQSI